MRRHVPAGLVLVLGGGLAALEGRRQHDLPEVVLIVGVSLLAAWLIERGRRFGPSGAVVAGLGAGLVVAEHAAGFGPYRDELIFGGIAIGILLAVQLVSGPLRGAGIALLAVALFETALQALPAHLSAPRFYAAFEQGWAFGLLLAVEGAFVLLGLGGPRAAVRGNETAGRAR